MTTWEWDESLYSGSAPHYARGRVPYPAELATALRETLGLDGTGRLLDVGCGPGSLTTLLAPDFAYAVGVDADPGMIRLARRTVPGIEWRCLRAEDLASAGLGRFRVLTFAQSFHWMDRDLVARIGRGLLEPGGAWVHVHATTHRGIESDSGTPWDAIDALVRQYLGPVRRAGKSLIHGDTPSGESEVMLAAGWSGPERLDIEWANDVVTRSVDEIIDATLSLSSSAPHLFGDDLAGFVADLRKLLLDASPDGVFAERLRELAVDVWRL